VSFGEDASRVRQDWGPENLNVPRKLALYLLKKTPVAERRRTGLRRKMLRASFNDSFLHQALFGLK
ncbi:MAG: hypothetical protein LBJ24_05515, partial [Treponema sp.]|jgi:hypothetical protein|nr:hypothetical protein [Treponema sp.]